MNRIDKLIAKLCPNGVEFKTLGEICQRTSSIKWAEARDVEFAYIDLSSVDRVTHAIGETIRIDANNAPSRAQLLIYA